ncbi:MAG: TlpA family protein disulfide reductase [Hyphomicrobiaceae bacterium]
MRGTLPVVVILAAGALFAAVYVSGYGTDNASGGKTTTSAGKTASPASSSTSSARLNKGKVAAFVYETEPEPVPAFPFFDETQQTTTIEAFKGKVVLLNLWATWCGPCREEMPALDKLQQELGSDKFEVVAVSVDKNGIDKAKEFMTSIGVKSLKFYADPTARAATKVKAIGMPATLLVDAEGKEIGRLMGPAEWDSPDAKRLIESVLN